MGRKISRKKSEIRLSDAGVTHSTKVCCEGVVAWSYVYGAGMAVAAAGCYKLDKVRAMIHVTVSREGTLGVFNVVAVVGNDGNAFFDGWRRST